MEFDKINEIKKLFHQFKKNEFLFHLCFHIFSLFQIIYYYFLNKCYDKYLTIFYCQNKILYFFSIIDISFLILFSFKKQSLAKNIIFIIIALQFSNVSLIES